MTAPQSTVTSMPVHHEPGASLGQDRLIDAAVAIVRCSYDVSQRIAVAALRDASRATSRPLWDVAAGLLLADHLPPSLLTRLRHSGL